MAGSCRPGQSPFTLNGGVFPYRHTTFTNCALRHLTLIIEEWIMRLFTSAIILSGLAATAIAGSRIEGIETQIRLNPCVEPVLR
jgi:hypothetical protein